LVDSFLDFVAEDAADGSCAAMSRNVFTIEQG
jgi:hypothetical protein